MSFTVRLARQLSNYDSQNSFGSKLRARRIAPLVEMIDSTFGEHGSVRIIDVGGTEKYWNIVPLHYLGERNVIITLVNIPGTVVPEDNGLFVSVVADGCDLAVFGDQSFHIGHSNSVIEHVGDWVRMVQFAKELSRVSERWFVQTPNYWFPIEPHFMTPFFHWLPKPIQVWLVLHLQLGQWRKAATVDDAVRIVESARLLNRSMFQALFKDSQILTERVFGLPKSFIVIKR